MSFYTDQLARTLRDVADCVAACFIRHEMTHEEYSGQIRISTATAKQCIKEMERSHGDASSELRRIRIEAIRTGVPYLLEQVSPPITIPREAMDLFLETGSVPVAIVAFHPAIKRYIEFVDRV